MKQLIIHSLVALLILHSNSCNSKKKKAIETSQETIEPDNKLVSKLKSIELDSVEFTEDTNVSQAINFLKLRARELDDSNIPSFDSDIVIIKTIGDPEAGIRKCYFNAYNVKLIDAIAKVAQTARVDAYVTSHGVRIVSEGANPIPKNRDDVKVVYVIHKN